jgi:general secretion pathway protein E
MSEPQTQRLAIPFVESLDARLPLPEFVAQVPIGFARRHQILGLRDNGRVTLAIGSDASLEQVQIIGRLLGRAVQPVMTTPAAVLHAINAAYQQRSGEASQVIESLGQSEAVLDEVRRLAAQPAEDLLDNAARAPVIKLVNLMLFDAVRAGASDVHVQPYEADVIVRLRIDGVLYDTFTLPKTIQEEVISRIKVMARMNIAEKLLPQDGRSTVQVGDRLIDLRVATLPTSFGERAVIRLLDKTARLYDLTELGMDRRTLLRFEQLIGIEHGLILVTGPTGSGKTTTLYAALRRLNTKEKNVLTIEDPIEYRLEGISQTQVSEKKGMTFASGLRSVLRQDPDVIMVGEIRDHETATMAIQSALTGHLVFSTLHTNDAASAVTRLLDLGIEPYLVASSLVGVLAQRLVRRICPECGRSCEPTATELRWLGVGQDEAAQVKMGGGCTACRLTGYRGRLGTFELITLDEPIRRLIQARAAVSEIRDAAVQNGTRTLRDDGVEKILAGLTTITEVERVTMRPEDSTETP